MADENWQRVREIFDALRRKSEERQKFICQACGDNKIVLAEVESLLSSLDGAESFWKRLPSLKSLILSKPKQNASNAGNV